VAVYTRYILNSASSWPNDGRTADGRHHLHRIGQLLSSTHPHEHDGSTDLLPPPLRHASLFLSEILMGVIALFMVVWGLRLVHTTWAIGRRFPWLSVGITYLPIVLSGAMMFLYVVERLTIGHRRRDGSDAHVPVE